MKIKHLTTLCGDKCKGCPEIFIDDEVNADKQILITDDFGKKINMSKDQFRILIQQAKKGELDV